MFKTRVQRQYKEDTCAFSNTQQTILVFIISESILTTFYGAYDVFSNILDVLSDTRNVLTDLVFKDVIN